MNATVEEFPFEGECRAAFAALQAWKSRLLDLAVDNPAEALLAVVAGGALVFYMAEKDVNEDVRCYGDALHYVSTCLAVGYARIYPATQTGKLVAAIIMTFGPSLSSWVLEGRLVARGPAPRGASPPGGAAGGTDALLAKLDAILLELRASRAGA